MTHRDSSNPIPASRRHPSLSLRTRSLVATPRSLSHPHSSLAAVPSGQDGRQKGNMDGERETWDSSLECGSDDNEQVLEETNQLPPPIPRPRGVKSFSNLRNPVDGLLALGRRLSVSIRRHTQHPLPDERACADYHKPHFQPHVRGGSWDARVKTTQTYNRYGRNANRRASVHSPTALRGFFTSNGLERPTIPDDACAGAAARASAAAHNEAKAERELSKLFEPAFSRDTESGIGIDLRDRGELSDVQSSVKRIGALASVLSVVNADC